jgi:hypothetical protein
VLAVPIKLCLNETCSKVGKCLSDAVPVQYALTQRDALGHVIENVQGDQGGLKLNGTHTSWSMLMMLIDITTEAVGDEDGLEMNTDGTKYA